MISIRCIIEGLILERRSVLASLSMSYPAHHHSIAMLSSPSVTRHTSEPLLPPVPRAYQARHHNMCTTPLSSPHRLSRHMDILTHPLLSRITPCMTYTSQFIDVFHWPPCRERVNAPHAQDCENLQVKYGTRTGNFAQEDLRALGREPERTSGSAKGSVTSGYSGHSPDRE